MSSYPLFAVSLLAQASDPPVVAGGQITSVWDFVLKGGPTMVVIGLCSLVALAVIVERLIVLRRRYVIPDGFVTSLKTVANDRTKALELCHNDDSPIARILSVSIRRRGQSTEAIEKAVGDAGTREMVRLRHRMRLLSALPQVSTMLGLLGTIFGMIKTFQAVAASGQSLGKTELLAKGIFEAWTCTAAGLLVAIPVLVAYHALMGRIDGLAVELDRVATDWVERETGVTPPPQPKTADAATASGTSVSAATPAVSASALQPAAGG